MSIVYIHRCRVVGDVVFLVLLVSFAGPVHDVVADLVVGRPLEVGNLQVTYPISSEIEEAAWRTSSGRGAGRPRPRQGRPQIGLWQQLEVRLRRLLDCRDRNPPCCSRLLRSAPRGSRLDRLVQLLRYSGWHGVSGPWPRYHSNRR